MIMLVLFHGDTSTASAKVRLALAEKRLSFESRLFVLRRGEHRNAEYLAINPAGVVPTLVHDGCAIVESSVILEYVEEAFPEPPLLPASLSERARTRALMRDADHLHDACSVLSSVVKLAPMRDDTAAVAAALARVADPLKRERQARLVAQGFDAPDIQHAFARYRAAIDSAADALEAAAWLSGANVGLADCALLPFIHRADRLGLAELWADRPTIAEWLSRMRARPSFATAVSAFEAEAPYRPSPELAARLRGGTHLS
jgi:glutathione S-transferase